MSSAKSQPLHTLVLGSVLIAAAAYFLVLRLFTPKCANLPPGPKPTSLLAGNSLPTVHPWFQLEKWTKQYGDIYTLRFGQTLLFVCGNATSANKILEKQASVTADRPRTVMAGEMISDDRRTLLLPHGKRWRVFRKILHETLQDKAAKEYEYIQIKELRIAMLQLGRDSSCFQNVFRRYAASVIMQVTYDYQITSLEDPLLKAVQGCLATMFKWLQPGQSTLYRYPFLLHIPTPLNLWKQEGLRFRKVEQDLFLGEYEKVRQRAAKGECQPCFVTEIQQKQKELGITDGDAASLAGSLFGAGSDTMAAALGIFVMAVCRFPNVLKEMQKEIDAVCGNDRLPTFDNMPSMPYLNATVQETLRWRPLGAGGFQHKLTQDIEYKGYVLPKGSSIVGPHWSISLNANEYQDPDTFNPARFLDDNDKFKGTWFAPQRGNVGFGFGRRICPGLHVADRSLAINLACMAWAFDIQEPSGNPEKVDTFAFTSGVVIQPLPFKATFTYRDEKRRTVVEEENRETGELERIA